MKKVKNLFKMIKFLCYTFFSLLLIFSLSACNGHDSTLLKTKEIQTVNNNHTVKPLFERVKPLSIEEDSFQKIVGWLDNETILYIADKNNQSDVYQYSLSSGQSKILYKSNSPIKNVLISPDKKMILIHSAPLTYLAKVEVIDLEGKVLLSKKVNSYDLTFNWNKQNPKQVFITVFFEDWTYKVNLLNLNDQTLKEYTFSDPFVKWFHQDDVLIQNWDRNEMHFFAPLLSYSLQNTNQGKTLFKRVYQFDTFPQYLMTITIPENNKDDAIYHFYNESLQEVYTFEVPHLSQYNNWVVPNYDFIRNKFITFVPYESGSVDEYSGKFKLTLYNVKTKNEEIITEKLKNESIVFSPDGKTILYGNQLNQLIDIEKGEIKSIVQYVKKSPQ
jgi:hypothetical protein